MASYSFVLILTVTWIGTTTSQTWGQPSYNGYYTKGYEPYGNSINGQGTYFTANTNGAAEAVLGKDFFKNLQASIYGRGPGETQYASNYNGNNFYRSGDNGYATSTATQEPVGSYNWLKKNANPNLPVFPQNYPFPPNCQQIQEIPGLQFPSDNIVTNIPVRKQITHKTFTCTDPRYSQPFYMLQTTASARSNDGSVVIGNNTNARYYNQNYQEITYEADVKYKPLYQ
ncbi:uncharacterized protein LOC142326241 [Lycorma delicatula]|uniref:uncharacterized protein LOC142326241 n=1 Tax=Lycorma delicatula TaxID=130591 RepID=UPI003F50E1B2